MFRKFFKKKAYKLYLGNIHVVERKDLKRFFDQPPPLFFESNESLLYRKLAELFELPSAQHLNQFSSNELAIDIIIPSYQGGSLLFGSIGVPVAFLWRPKVEVLSRIYRLEDRKMLSEVKIISKQPWIQFFKGLLTFNFFQTNDLEPLLLQCCSKAIARHSKNLRVN
ncbi:hypothetical protein [Endozoicomonas arenosclerae]|uniref:hypothetical protein n=1 Tax=Endozoicomonas arenosclerae TaxID=1633495 RepID=UPI000782199B|nr:hypothetical protein [Endozoicomonas arenosclerae]